MNPTKLMGGTLLAALFLLGACSDRAGKNMEPASDVAAEAAGEATIAQGLGNATKFAAAARAAGLEATFAGLVPYTVLVPTDAAFDKLPAGTLDALMKEDARAELTGVLTYHILPGAILTSDIAKAIDAGNGKTMLPTMAGGTLTATREGNAIVISDGSGTRARLVSSDEKRSNGVIHRVDAVMMPG